MLRIAVTGPESTGKSTLAKQLAKYYHTVFIPEYAREYLEKLNRPYDYHDVEKIALAQIKLENSMMPEAKNLIIADTELVVIKIWMEHKFGKIPGWLTEKIKHREYDLYLLCDIDFPWIFDPQREHPHLRKYFFDKYREEIERRGFQYIIISGSRDTRLSKATQAIDRILSLHEH